MKTQRFAGVSAVERSENAKIGTVSATYASQTTCPPTCPFMDSGCYAETGNVGFQTSRLNKESDAASLSALQLARHEASAIRTLTGTLPLRLHVVGDCRTNATAKIVSRAADEYRAKHDRPVWSYTHAWKDVNRASWGKVSVLASCETTADAKRAMSNGYAAAMVVSAHQDTKAYEQDGIKLVPCPQQTGKAANCEACRLCFRDDILREVGSVIAFAAHGSTKKVANALIQIEGAH